MASWDVALTVVYPIPDRISDGYLTWDRIYYGWLFIGSKNKLVQHDKVLYEEIMMNDDNLESNLLTSSLLETWV